MTFDKQELATILIAVVALCAGCGSNSESNQANSSSSSSAPTAHVADCAVHPPGPSTIDDVLAPLPGFTVDKICPVDVDPALSTADVTAEFLATTAGKVSAHGNAVLSVFAGQLKTDTGDAFVQTFLRDLSSKAQPTKTVATDTKDVGGFDVTHFNIPADAAGYTYAAGPTVVIAYNVAGGPKTDEAEAALAKALANLH